MILLCSLDLCRKVKYRMPSVRRQLSRTVQKESDELGPGPQSVVLVLLFPSSMALTSHVSSVAHLVKMTSTACF